MTIQADRAKQILSKFSQQRILVVGDLMLDRYLYGGVHRISPEAPVPVVLVSREKTMPGGATNVAWNVLALGGKSAVSGVVGKDAAGSELRRILTDGVITDGVLEVPEMRTTVKMRIVAERQQVVRVDWEDKVQLSGPMKDQYLRLVESEVRKSTGVIIEDYSKGVVGQDVVDAVLRAAKESNIPVGLDPKDNREVRFAGITVATPNRKEAYESAGVRETEPGPDPLRDRNLLDVGSRLLKQWNASLVIVTLGPQGMLLVPRTGTPTHVPTRAREVFDVSGAGDTVIATCVLALASGATHEEAAELANYAAGVVVGKLGTATCTQDELIQYMG